MRIQHLNAAAGLLLGLALAAPLAAQNRLYVLESDNGYHPVFKVSRGRPYIQEKGRLVPAGGQRFALRKVDEYLPALVSVRDLEVRTTGMRSVDTSSVDRAIFNNEFHFSARFESSFALDDVFVVLEVEAPNVGNSFFVYEVGQLQPRIPETLSVDVQLGRNLGPGRLKLHLFSGGSEVFTSEQPPAFREEMLDRMIAKRIADVREAPPKPFYGEAPEYPAALRNTGARGEAVVTMRVTPRGAVLDPVVDSASDPAFGEAAVSAARQWRFLPKVEAGRAVETKVKLPLVFDPPNEGEKR